MIGNFSNSAENTGNKESASIKSFTRIVHAFLLLTDCRKINMQYKIIFLVLLVFAASALSLTFKEPTVLVSVLVRNKQHTLPYFLSNLENLNYPKDRMSIW